MNDYYKKKIIQFGPLVRKIFKVQIHGLENIPEDGHYLFCPNHLSLADVMIMAAVVPRQVRFMAKKELFSIPLISSLIKGMGAVPINRGAADVSALKKMISFYEEGGDICVYPQGHRNPGKHPKDTVVHNGVGLISYKAKCDVIPVGFFGKGWKLRPFRENHIIFGKVIKYVEMPFEHGTTAEFKEATDIIFNGILNNLKAVEEC